MLFASVLQTFSSRFLLSFFYIKDVKKTFEK